MTFEALVRRLRSAGCVFAEDEAAILWEAAAGETELEGMCARREAGEFLEHIVGAVDIAGHRLSVGPGVFVPRQRTAALIEATVAAARRRRRPVVLEACCGVAPVAAVVARRLPGARLHAADADARALAHARRNLPAGAGVHLGDGLAALPDDLTGRIDVIAAVPPYVPAAELPLMPREAREHEDAAALVAGEDGLDHVHRLLHDAPDRLAAGGTLLIEMHRDQAPAALARAEELGAYACRDVRIGQDGRTAVVQLESRSGSVPAPHRSAVVPEDLVLLRRVRDRIDREYAEPLDVQQLAQGVHLSAGHLSRRFRKEFGETPYSYLMTRRVERAMTLLRMTESSVTDVCMDVGFSSLGTFSTRFKELVGVTPSRYREQGAEVLDSMPPCIARKITRPVRNEEAAWSPPR